MPAWSHNGRELFYVRGASSDAEAEMMAVQVTAGAEFQAGAPVPLFRARFQPINWLRSCDVGLGGRFLAVLRDPAPTTPGAASLRITFNWFEELKRLAPTN